MTCTLLIVNADDFGCTEGVNRGIAEAHVRGIVTSTSLMVNRPAAAEAAASLWSGPSWPSDCTSSCAGGPCRPE